MPFVQMRELLQVFLRKRAAAVIRIKARFVARGVEQSPLHIDKNHTVQVCSAAEHRQKHIFGKLRVGVEAGAAILPAQQLAKILIQIDRLVDAIELSIRGVELFNTRSHQTPVQLQRLLTDDRKRFAVRHGNHTDQCQDHQR